MICKSKLRVLFAMGVFVLGITTFASAGELIDDVLANIEQNSPELASTFENIFAIPEVEELAFAIESYFQQNGEIRDKQAGCQWHTPYSSICEFLDDLNACADIHKGELTDAITADLKTTFPLLPLPAAQANWSWMTATRSTDKEDYFCDQAGKCPSWYYHFLRGEGTMGNGSRSYIYLQYANDVGNIPGAIVFYVDEPEWETKVIGQNIDWTPFLWRTSDGEQNIYFSCSLGLFDGDGRTLDELVRLALLISYWEVTDTEALSSLLNEDYYFLPWFIGELIDELVEPDFYCEETKARGPRGSGDWDFCNWYASPPLVLTDEWFYQMFDDNWSTYKRSDYFDHIMLWVSPQAPNVDIEVSWLRIRLNGRVILDYQSATAPLLFSGNSPLYLSEYIKDCRKQYLSPTLLVNGICSLPSSGSPPLFAKILEEASKDYGQGWDYRYASHWCKDCEDAVDPIWPPLPNTWCTEYACYLMSKHINLYPKCTDIFDDPHNLGVPDMWWYFWLLGQLLHQTYRISPFDKVCPWQGCPYWSWDMLADAIGSGYYVGYHYTGGGGEKHWHSTLFIDWVADQTPNDLPCCAAFYAIGGNQSNGRVSINTFGMKNMVDSDCKDVDCSAPSQIGISPELLWGRTYNLFGKTN